MILFADVQITSIKVHNIGFSYTVHKAFKLCEELFNF